MSDDTNTPAVTPVLAVRDLHVAVEGKEILTGLNLTVNPGEMHAIMGRNGSGKTTLSAAIMGHPRYEITSGSVEYRGENLLELPVDERARRGVFLSFQYPQAVPGVTVANFLRHAVRAVRGDEVPTKDFRPLVKQRLADLGIPNTFMTRYVNDGFSGGEKKRLEMLQMVLLRPHLAILDETDSGLDIDALKVVSDAINALRDEGRAQILITHYQRILQYVEPDHVHVLLAGRIVRSGGPELAHELEAHGYEGIERDAA